ncbi:hypothetical protein N7466_005279 [Penicillium verhagenii]|uniref:uncharacterized protein n=1 Tax=Penicillium verhagenii TaxID=1562060 RepID=UPI0025454102|nr:uncharacterized protein N7466_005279 [Penicillium verhagenii]KAJ5935732.1 hypothetical protein N7466_005279 [Penicillium verhagenii]
MPPAGSTTNGRSNRASTSKVTPSSLVVTLKLSPKALRQLLGEPLDGNSPDVNLDKSADRASPASSAEVPAVRPSSADNGSDVDAASTPAAGATPGDTPQRKGVPGPKPGNKRSNGQSDAASRSRGRPGPKKKPRLDEGGGDAGKPAANHRIGPKANTGAINAGLRALDRTGAPCRKWDRQPLKLRSFTGVAWELPAWHSFKTAHLDSELNKDGILESGDSDSKPTLAVPGPDTLNGSSAVPSEKSTGDGDGDVTPAPSTMVAPSSPAIAMAA